MLNYNQIVGKLIAKRKSNQQVIAACIYGSYAQGISTPSSDLNVLLVTKDKESYQGCYRINGVKVVYFEKSFITIMNEIEQCHKVQDPFYASLLRTCEVIFDSNHMIPYLQYQQVRIESYKNKVRQLELDDFPISYYNSKCNEYHEENPYFDHYYYVLLEYIRKMYHQENGYSPIATQQVFDLYRDSRKASYYYVQLPDTKFQEFFLNCIMKEDSTREEKKQMLKEAFGYLKMMEFSQAGKKEPNQLDIHCIPNYAVTYFQDYQKLILNQSRYGIKRYPYHNLVEQITKLNSLCEKKGKESFITKEESQQLILSENPMDIEEALNKICKQIKLNPNQYEISCFQKKYKI